MVMKLKSYGYDVITADDGSAAVAAIGRLKPDLILLDLNFPPDVAHGGGLGWDGFLILRWLRRTREAVDVPVIAVTGGDLNLYREHCKEAGILDLLAKPLDHELLVTRIRAVLNQRETETKQQAPPPSKFQSVRRILFIDDDSPWRQGAIQDLSEQGYEVLTTDTAEMALSEAARIRPDLMILDLKLEKETALKVMVLLLAAHPSVPLLVYAGMGLGEQGKRELMNLGVFQILQKRTMNELLTAVQSASEQPRRVVQAPQTKPETNPSEVKVRFDTILIVEGDLQFSELLRGYLESQSFYVTCVSDATEALRQMASTDFDVILTEMVLPGHSGEDFYTEVERVTPELCRRFVFMTGHEAEPRTDNFIRRSRASMLWKPFPMADLLTAVQTLQRKDWLTRVVARSRSVIS
jgi:DNA-binding response OmpR family regulator